jgi:drug/metabolite transporter (DMT)-like permease
LKNPVVFVVCLLKEGKQELFRLLFGRHPHWNMIVGVFLIIVGVVALVNPALLDEKSGNTLGPAILAFVLGSAGIITGIVGYVRRSRASSILPR